MSIPHKRYQTDNWCIEMTKSRITDLLVGILVVLWMGWTFATVQEYGPDPWLIGGAVMIGVFGTLMLYGHRVDYLQLGDKLVVGLETRHDRRETDEERKKHR